MEKWWKYEQLRCRIPTFTSSHIRSREWRARVVSLSTALQLLNQLDKVWTVIVSFAIIVVIAIVLGNLQDNPFKHPARHASVGTAQWRRTIMLFICVFTENRARRKVFRRRRDATIWLLQMLYPSSSGVEAGSQIHMATVTTKQSSRAPSPLAYGNNYAEWYSSSGDSNS